MSMIRSLFCRVSLTLTASLFVLPLSAHALVAHVNDKYVGDDMQSQDKCGLEVLAIDRENIRFKIEILNNDGSGTSKEVTMKKTHLFRTELIGDYFRHDFGKQETKSDYTTLYSSIDVPISQNGSRLDYRVDQRLMTPDKFSKIASTVRIIECQMNKVK